MKRRHGVGTILLVSSSSSPTYMTGQNPGLSETVSFLICEMWVISYWVVVRPRVQAIIKGQFIKTSKQIIHYSSRYSDIITIMPSSKILTDIQRIFQHIISYCSLLSFSACRYFCPMHCLQWYQCQSFQKCKELSKFNSKKTIHPIKNGQKLEQSLHQKRLQMDSK